MLLRRIFGPTQKANGEWRLKTNEELEEAINNENIVRYIKYKRLSWLGHVERMTNGRVAKTIYKWKPYATRPKGRPRVRWEDDVRNDLRKMGVSNWKQTTQERKKWKEITEQAKTHKEKEKNKFCYTLGKCVQFSRFTDILRSTDVQYVLCMSERDWLRKIHANGSTARAADSSSPRDSTQPSSLSFDDDLCYL